MSLQPAVCINDLCWVRGGRQRLRDQSIRIERHRCYQLIELVWSEGLSGCGSIYILRWRWRH